MSYINSIRLVKFRSYDDFAFELSPEVNIVIGPNASGKTNLLESIILLAGNTSYRASNVDLIKHGQESSKIDAIIGDTNRSCTIQLLGDKYKKKYTINGVTKQNLKFEELLPFVLFEPENMRLLTGSPDMRRDFLDELLSTINPSFGSYKKQYLRVLSQRNRLLKNHSSKNQQLFIWNLRLSELGGYIFEARNQLINTFNQQISQIYSQIAGQKTSVVLNYQTNISTDNYESSLMNKLEQDIAKDIERGFTSSGPHRDDFAVELNQNRAKISASRGETRTLVLSLKILSVEMIKNMRSLKPIILLDDVFGELDGSRRQALTNYFKDNQTIITTTDADVVAKDFAQHTNLIGL